jgi:hypothetical protein
LNPLASPELAVVGADRPIPGTTLTVRGRNLPDAGLSVLTLGLSDQFQGSTPLPAPLSSFGLAGACPLLASADLFNPVATANGAFDAPLPVPAGLARADEQRARVHDRLLGACVTNCHAARRTFRS